MKEPTEYRCDECGFEGELSGDDLWYDNEDGMTYHLVERDIGGGHSRVEACGPVRREDETEK